VPDAEQCISYRIPAFCVNGKVIAGFAAFTEHLSCLPFSGSILGQLGDTLVSYSMTKSALHFTADNPLPEALLRKLIASWNSANASPNLHRERFDVRTFTMAYGGTDLRNPA
jgi:uncharacterized protein YdhG (YjbR/CyaY superfamily)